MKRVFRWVGRIAILLLLLTILAGVGGWFYLQHSLPQLAGEARAPGLGQAVEIVRDAEGVPHIFAKTEHDGWYAMGYLHAQDRLWQMEVQRRVAQGRISEVFGEVAYDTDRLMRALGFAPLSVRILERLDDDTRAARMFPRY